MKTAITFDDIAPGYLDLDLLKELLKQLDLIGIRGTMFVVPFYKGIFRWDGEFLDLLRHAHSSGHEIALHGYTHKRREFGLPLPILWPGIKEQEEKLKMGRQILEDLLRDNIVGFRAPHYLHNKLTLRALAKLQFKYDSSKSLFKPVHLTRRRIRTLNSCHPKFIQNILEIPITGDYTYSLNSMNYKATLERAVRDFIWMENNKTMFVTVFHVHRSNLALDMMRDICKELSHKTVFIRLRDFNK